MRSSPAVAERVREADRFSRAKDFEASLRNLDAALAASPASPPPPSGRTGAPSPPSPGGALPSDPRSCLLLRRAGALLGGGKWEAAKVACEAAIEEAAEGGNGPASPKWHAYLAAAHLGLGEVGLAKARCLEALSLDGSLRSARYWLACCWFKEEDWRRCGEEAGRVLREGPFHWRAWEMRCESRRRMGQWRGVERDCQAALKRREGQEGEAGQGGVVSSIWCARAEALLNLGQAKDAEFSGTEAIFFDPSSLMAHQIRGEARYQLRKYKLAVADFSEYGRLDRIRREVPFASPCYSIWNSNRSRSW